jgi:cold-inducible RNA-binding protein
MKIYVGNLSFDATEADIEQAFAQYGDVKSVSIIKDRDTGRSRGFGFVEMRDGQAGQQAINGLNMQQIAGRAVTVNEARPREDRRGGGGGGGGGRRW